MQYLSLKSGTIEINLKSTYTSFADVRMNDKMPRSVQSWGEREEEESFKATESLADCISPMRSLREAVPNR